jgi:hypothetical protein
MVHAYMMRCAIALRMRDFQIGGYDTPGILSLHPILDARRGVPIHAMNNSAVIVRAVLAPARLAT